jgi:hypothetical protein
LRNNTQDFYATLTSFNHLNATPIFNLNYNLCDSLWLLIGQLDNSQGGNHFVELVGVTTFRTWLELLNHDNEAFFGPAFIPLLRLKIQKELKKLLDMKSNTYGVWI